MFLVPGWLIRPQCKSSLDGVTRACDNLKSTVFPPSRLLLPGALAGRTGLGSVLSDLSPLLPHPFGLRYRYAVALTVGGVLLVLWSGYWITRLARAKTLAGIGNCPDCHSSKIGKAGEKRLVDSFFRLFRCWPYRCYDCGTRYFRAL